MIARIVDRERAKKDASTPPWLITAVHRVDLSAVPVLPPTSVARRLGAHAGARLDGEPHQQAQHRAVCSDTMRSRGGRWRRRALGSDRLGAIQVPSRTMGRRGIDELQRRDEMP